MEVLHLTKENFKKTLEGSSLPVLVDFWAPWCGPCKMLGPVFEEAAQKLDGKALLAKVCVDDEAELAREYSVMSIPTIIAFRSGKECSRSVGYIDLDEIISIVGR